MRAGRSSLARPGRPVSLKPVSARADTLLEEMAGPLLLAVLEAAVVGVWIAVRWPTRTPRTPVTLAAALVVALVLLHWTPLLVRWLTGFGGPPAALTLGVLPTFAFVFWAVACLARTAVDHAGGGLRLRP